MKGIVMVGEVVRLAHRVHTSSASSSGKSGPDPDFRVA
jgi:hypothetical protein